MRDETPRVRTLHIIEHEKTSPMVLLGLAIELPAKKILFLALRMMLAR